MAHSQILGMTESGKTTLAKHLAHKYQSAGKSVLVLDPLNDPGWKLPGVDESRYFQTYDPELFLEVFWKSRSCYAFIDEGGDMVGRFDKTMEKTATRGRHWGHSVHYISQRGASMNLTVRAQCRHLFLFAMAMEDCKTYAREYNQPQLLEAANFQAGEFFHVQRFGQLGKHNIFTGA